MSPHATCSSYVAVRVESAVNLLDAREFAGRGRAERLSAVLADERRFLAGLGGFGGRAAFDLRWDVDPRRPVPIELSIIVRAWSHDPDDSATRARDAGHQVLAAMPRHVTAALVDDPGVVAASLDPYPGSVITSAVISKRQIVGTPSRPDAGVERYYSIRPFTMTEMDWGPLYDVLRRSPVPVTLSVAAFPWTPPPGFGRTLSRVATFYGRLAREDETPRGLYYGPRHLPPDAFAVEAERVFLDYLRRCSDAAFMLRIQVSSPGLSPGLVEAVAAAVSPPETFGGSHLERDRVATTCDVRWSHDMPGTGWVRHNLTSVDCVLLPTGNDGSPAFGGGDEWLPLLATVGDAADVACAFRLPSAVDGVVPGFRVRRGHFGHSEAYGARDRGIEVGTVAGGTESVRITLSGLTRHALVAGSPGSGKTTTVLELLRQLWVLHSTPFLVVEPVNSDADDYRRLLDVPGLETMRVITVGDERVSPLRFNPFQVPEGVLVSEHAANLLAGFQAAFGLWNPLPEIYRAALDQLYTNAGVTGVEVGARGMHWPTVVEFEQVMRMVVARAGYSGDVKANIEAASVIRVQQLCRGVVASCFLTDQTLDVADLLARPTLVELRSLGSGDEQALVMALLLSAMTEHYKVHRPIGGGLHHVTVIEEAHRLLARPSGGADSNQAQAKERAANEFANALAENRKYGEGIIIAEQIPSKLVDDAVKNTNLKIMHRLTSDEDRHYLGESMGMDLVQQRFGTRLATGEALVFADEFAEAVHVEVGRVVGSAMPDVTPTASPPFEGCHACRVKCRYRGAALSALGDPEVARELARTRQALGRPGMTAAESEAGWADLTSTLHRQLARFPVFPRHEPDVQDAAFCLFLHGRARATMTPSKRWSTAVAQQLGVLPTSATVGSDS